MNSSEPAKQKYQKLVEQVSPNSNILVNCLKAFVVGGLICSFGQFIINFTSNLGYTQDETALFASITLIFIAALLTGIGVYDDIGKFSGAGSLVPITGFSNSIVAPALEFKKEGFVFGVGSSMFIIAGPVILYGTVTSVIVGIIYYFVA